MGTITVLAERDSREGLTAGPEALCESDARELQHAIDSVRTASSAPGVQVSIRQEGRLLWSGVSGTTGDGRTALTHEHVFRIGDVTSTFIAALILQLATERRLQLDDTIERWFPALRNARHIRISNLLEHSSGVRDFRDRSFCRALAAISPRHRFASADAIAYLSRARPCFAPGTTARYSTSNHLLLSAIAEQVAGATAASLIRGRLLSPLLLHRTFCLPDETSELPPHGLVTGYDRDRIPVPGSYRVRADNVAWATLASTSGAMASTADDLAIWLDALVQDAIVPDFRLAAVTSLRKAADPAIPELLGYGPGLERLAIYGEEWLGHTGNFLGFGGAVLHAPRMNRTICVLGNVSTFGSADAVRLIQRALAYIQDERPPGAPLFERREHRGLPAETAHWN
jgi:D-alanyl-D-alanine carboxypeptidase